MSELSLEKNYYLLVLDIKKSTSMPPEVRTAVFDKLQKQVAQLNKTLDPQPVRALSLAYGDEVAGLFETPAQLYHIVSTLRQAIYPQGRFRFAICLGKVGIVADELRSVGGAVFKEADVRLKRLKKQGGFGVWSTQQPQQDAVLNALISMSNLIFERMTPYQRQVFELLSAGHSGKEIAAKLKRYPQSVSRAIQTGGAEEVVKAAELIEDILIRKSQPTQGLLNKP